PPPPPASPLFPSTTLFRSQRVPQLVRQHRQEFHPAPVRFLERLVQPCVLDGHRRAPRQLLRQLQVVGPVPASRDLELAKELARRDRKSTRLNSSHSQISYA